MTKNSEKTSVEPVCHITLPLRHIKATVRTGKTGKEGAFFHKKTREIFWQSVSGKLHFRPNIMAKSKTKLFSTIRKSAGIPLAGWQGIMAKPADNCDKAQSGPGECGRWHPQRPAGDEHGPPAQRCECRAEAGYRGRLAAGPTLDKFPPGRCGARRADRGDIAPTCCGQRGAQRKRPLTAMVLSTRRPGLGRAELCTVRDKPLDRLRGHAYSN